jgi:hypothetical protein
VTNLSVPSCCQYDPPSHPCPLNYSTKRGEKLFLVALGKRLVVSTTTIKLLWM